MITGVFLLLFLTNMARYSVVPPLTEDPVLDQKAQARAEYLCTNDQWSHDGWEDSFSDTSYAYHGENLAKGYRTYGDTNHALMISPAHRENIMNPNFQYMGVGQACGKEVELFGGY